MTTLDEVVRQIVRDELSRMGLGSPETLEALRLAKGFLTWDEAAAACGVSRASLCRIAAGQVKHLNVELLNRIAAGWELDPLRVQRAALNSKLHARPRT